MKWFLILLGALFAQAGFGALALLRTTDGREISGELRATTEGLTLTTTNGTTATLALTNLAQGRFNLTNVAELTSPPAPKEDGALPPGWQAQDIGPVGAAGRAMFRGGSFTLAGAGDTLWSTRPDTFLFAYRMLQGDGQIIARITATGARSTGVMMRDSADPNALFSAVFYEKGGSLIYRNRRGEKYRRQFVHEGDWHHRDHITLPRHLKLVRQGNEFKSYLSWNNGEHWENFHQGPVEMGSNILVGLFVLSGDQARTAEAQFDQVTVTALTEDSSAPGRLGNAVAVVLRDGNVVVGEISSADETVLKLQRQGRTLALSTPQVARVLFQKFSTPTGGAAVPDRAGLLMVGGDFLDGDFAGIERGEVKMSSVLFGVRRYRLAKEAKALALRAVVPVTPAWEVQTIDGSVWLASTVRLGSEALSLSVPVMGEVKVAWAELVELRRGGR